jgi:hypothetical protein
VAVAVVVVLVVAGCVGGLTMTDSRNQRRICQMMKEAIDQRCFEAVFNELQTNIYTPPVCKRPTHRLQAELLLPVVFSIVSKCLYAWVEHMCMLT